LQVAALMHLGSTFYYHKEAKKALQVYQEGLPYIDDVAPQLRSRVYIGLGTASALCKQKQNALRYLHLTQEAFPQHPEDDPTFLYTEFGLSSLYMFEGWIYLDLNEHYPDAGYPEQALHAFARVEKYLPKMIVSERVRIEIINHRAKVAVALKNMEDCCSYLEQASNGAKMLQRYTERLSP